MHSASGQVLWETSQWRAAHRQWQLDPLNALINLVAHAGASREERIEWLAEQMLKTLPDGPITVVKDSLLDKAVEVAP